jgi:hypothetical protein
LSHFLSENRFPPRIKCGAGFFRKMLGISDVPVAAEYASGEGRLARVRLAVKS